MDYELAEKLTIQLCIKYEGVYLRPYLCPAGIPTIGVGATFYEDGTKVKLTDQPITMRRAESLLRKTIKEMFMPGVVFLCPSIDTPERLAAITDFAFNLGLSALKNSTLRKKINSGDWSSAKKEILKWNKANGKELEGLKKRRLAESLMM